MSVWFPSSWYPSLFSPEKRLWYIKRVIDFGLHCPLLNLTLILASCSPTEEQREDGWDHRWGPLAPVFFLFFLMIVCDQYFLQRYLEILSILRKHLHFSSPCFQQHQKSNFTPSLPKLFITQKIYIFPMKHTLYQTLINMGTHSIKPYLTLWC